MEGNGTTTIQLSQYDVYKKVQTNSYYTGESRKIDTTQLDAAARIQTSTDEEDILSDFFNQAANHLQQALTRFLGETSAVQAADAMHAGYQKVTFTIKSPTNFMTSQSAQLADVMEDEAVYLVLRDWLSVMKPGEEVFAHQKITELENNLRMLVNNRVKPQRV